MTGLPSEVVIVGRVRTMDPASPEAAGIVVRSGRVAGFLADPDDRPRGQILRFPPHAVVIPGFVDPHLHLLGMAARRLGLDIGGEDLTTDELLVRIGRAAALGGWVRVYGVDEAVASDRRRPSRAELDRVSPRTPVIVRHRAGYEALLNSAALVALGAGPAAEEWMAAANPLVAALPPHDPTELADAVEAVFGDLVRMGITAVVDATFENDAEAMELIGSRVGPDGPRVAMMPGIGALDDLAAAGLGFGSLLGPIPLRHVKILPAAAGGVDVGSAVAWARELGWPVAIHAIDVDEVAEAVAALGVVPGEEWPGDVTERVRDRIEHCGLSLPDQIEDVARTGASVVTQPGFLALRGAKYREELSAVEREWIYRVASLRRAGILVAASSDAPVIPADPFEAMMAARTRGGDEATGSERVDASTALRMVTRDAAVAAAFGGGRLVAGSPADVVILSDNPGEGVDRPAVLATFVDGRLVHAADGAVGR